MGDSAMIRGKLYCRSGTTSSTCFAGSRAAWAAAQPCGSISHAASGFGVSAGIEERIVPSGSSAHSRVEYAIHMLWIAGDQGQVGSRGLIRFRPALLPVAQRAE